MRLLVFAMLVLLAGCVTVPPRKPTGLQATAFWKDQAARRTALGSLSAKTRVRYESPRETVSGRGRALTDLKRGGRLELRDPLGRTQYLAVLERDRFTAYYPSQKRAYRDKVAGKAYLKQFLGLPLSFRDLQSALVGLLPPSMKIAAFSTWEWDEGEGYYRGATNDGRITAHVDGDTAALRKLQWETDNGTVHVEYRSFEPCCGEKGAVPLGHEVKVTVGKSSSVEAEWEDVTRPSIALPATAFELTVPEGVNLVHLP